MPERFERELERLVERFGLDEAARQEIAALVARAAASGAKTLVLEENEVKVDATAVTEVFDRRTLPADPEPPTLMEGRYEELGLIASGGMGDVERVRDAILNRTVARKVLRSEAFGRHEIERFIEEAQATAQLQHPNVVPVHELGRLPDGRLYFTMKEVRGQTLTQVIRDLHEVSRTGAWATTTTGWTFRKVLEAFHKACNAVAYAHARGIVHRDLKPDNVMVGDFGEVQVMDWGLAKVVDEDTADPLQLRSGRTPTRHGKIAGTPSHMSPEQAYGEPTSTASDVYSLGATLYEILSGHPPYVAADPREVVRQLRRGDPPLPLGRVVDHLSFSSTRGFTHSDAGSPSGRRAPPLPREVVDIVRRAMARNQIDRYADATGLAEDITSWLDGAKREEQALGMVERAQELVPEVLRLHAEASGKLARAKALLAEIPRHAPCDRKEEAWKLEDEAARIEEDGDQLDLDAETLLRGALTYAPGLPAAVAAIAERLRTAHQALEGLGDRRGANRIQAQLDQHTRDLPEDHVLRRELELYLQGDGALSLATEPEAEVLLYRFVEQGRRLDPVAVGSLGRTPLTRVRLAMGTYQLVLRAPGRAEVRYPVCIERQGRWSGVPPGATELVPVALPEALSSDECYVPGGWARLGATAAGPQRVWVDGFVIRRHPVTHAEYLAFVDDLVTTGRRELALRHLPCVRDGSDRGRPLYVQGSDGRFTLPTSPDQEGDLIRPDWPVFQVDFWDACAFTRWVAAKSGLPWRLPSEWEWEKAARGVDGRTYPWGEQEEDSWACTLFAHEGRPTVHPVDAFPDDESPYGMRGASGNVMDWCLDPYDHALPTTGDRVVVADPGTQTEDPSYRSVRGGCWNRALRLTPPAQRASVLDHSRLTEVGFRLARSFPG